MTEIVNAFSFGVLQLARHLDVSVDSVLDVANYKVDRAVIKNAHLFDTD